MTSHIRSVRLRVGRTIDLWADSAVRGLCVTLLIFRKEAIKLVITLVSLSPDITGYGRSLAEPSRRLRSILFVHEDNHPHTHCTGLAEKRRAVDPAGSAFFVVGLEVWDGMGQPAYFGGDAAGPVAQGAAKRVANASITTDTV